ncbi:hypothetical protein [Gracilimonas mengyeensis]|uniref:DUF4382 domain-containing protein n=1 Tax=Gracilimonas mengyeensis TaxID=1302730 RepID=A0A521EYY3_9BACT|nr:hypothetical protein [Gracilimonas mengyeensis]SMO89158.1 hypothetical protein SAMN06265219_11460 [Gracilimonas mengyeensis]
MKRIKKISVLAIGLLAMMISVTSCDFGALNDAVDDFKVVIGLEPINTTSTVLLKDASTGELISRSVQVQFEGENGDDVIDVYSDPVDEDEVDGGILNFGIDNSVTPSETNPVRVRLIAEANGYVTTSKTVAIESEGANEFRIRMMRENDRPSGVNASTNNNASASDDGTVEASYTVNANSSDGESGTTVEVASGTRFVDADGNALTGQLRTRVTNYSPSDVSAMQAIPVDLVDEEGNPIVVAGASQLRVTDANGRVASSAELTAKSKVDNHGPVSYTVRVPAASSLRVGEEVYVFGFNANGESIISAPYPVEELGNGNLGVVYTSSEVPFVTVVASLLTFATNTCSPLITVNRNGNNGAITGRVFGTGIVADLRIPQGVSSGSVEIVPATELTVELQTASGAVFTETVNICAQGGSYTVDLPAPPSNLIDATMEASLVCQNPDESVSVTDLPGASVLYRKTDAPQGAEWRVANNTEWDFDEENNALSGGSFDVQDVEQGAEYTFRITFDGETYERDVVVTGTTVTYEEVIESDICG